MKQLLAAVFLCMLIATPSFADEKPNPADILKGLKAADSKAVDQLNAIAAKQLKAKKKVVVIAGPKSHGYGSHEHKAGCMLLAKLLNESMSDQIETVVVTEGWPKDESVFDGADAIVIYADGGGRHPIMRNLRSFKALVAKGVGVGCVHYGVEVPRGSGGVAMLEATGGYFETKWSVNPHWTTTNVELAKKHPITQGVKPYEMNDEWYYHMRFPGEMKGVTPILSAHPPKDTLKRPDGNHSGNPDVRKAVAEGKIQHLMWAYTRPEKGEGTGRGFGFTGGHYHWNWAHPDHRKLVMNGIAWIAGVDVPKDGVPAGKVTLDDLKANQDYEAKANFNYAEIEKNLNAWQKK